LIVGNSRRVHQPPYDPLAIDPHVYPRPDLPHPDRIPVADGEPGLCGRVEKALASGIIRVGFAEFDPVRLQDEVVEVRIVPIVPDDPGDFPEVRFRTDFSCLAVF
jgi:hypothetical protein